MDWTHLVAFNIALLAAIASPGPALLMAIKTTLSSGRRAGFALGAGLGVVAALWTLSALLGLEVIFAVFPWAYWIVKTVGAAYLIWIAWGMWRGAGEPVRTGVKPAAHAFRQGMIVNLLNPKSMLFAAAVLVVIFPKHMSPGENLLIVANHLVVELLFYAILAATMSRPAVSAGYLRAKIHIDRVAAAVLGLLGLRLLVSR